MENLINNLGPNKVTLDIKSNGFEETRKTYVATDVFSKIPDIMDMYNYDVCNEIFYELAVFLDPTVSLLGEKKKHANVVRDMIIKTNQICLNNNNDLFTFLAERFKVTISYEDKTYDHPTSETVFVLEKHAATKRLPKLDWLKTQYPIEKLNSMLVKELEIVAGRLNISKTNPDTKKRYLKQDLKDVIIQKLYADR